MSAEEEEAGVHAANARALQEECQVELNQAMPALHGESLVMLSKGWTRKRTYNVPDLYTDVFCIHGGLCIFTSTEIKDIYLKKHTHIT